MTLLLIDFDQAETLRAPSPDPAITDRRAGQVRVSDSSHAAAESSPV
ncbi:MAG: hypothetical protein L0H41_15360 [Microlunatus sp.]|nr:hypothetical protein [Microlunatus sp.]